jgi:hypothetical protein
MQGWQGITASTIYACACRTFAYGAGTTVRERGAMSTSVVAVNNSAGAGQEFTNASGRCRDAARSSSYETKFSSRPATPLRILDAPFPGLFFICSSGRCRLARGNDSAHKCWGTARRCGGCGMNQRLRGLFKRSPSRVGVFKRRQSMWVGG